MYHIVSKKTAKSDHKKPNGHVPSNREDQNYAINLISAKCYTFISIVGKLVCSSINLCKRDLKNVVSRRRTYIDDCKRLHEEFGKWYKRGRASRLARFLDESSTSHFIFCNIFHRLACLRVYFIAILKNT